MAEQITEEQYLIERIEDIQAQYQKAVQPYIDRLVKIRSRQLTPRMILYIGSISEEAIQQIAKDQ